MTQPTRGEAMATLREGQARLDELMAQLSGDQKQHPATIGGGDWSAKDLIAHVARWEEIAMEALGDWRAGRKPWIEEYFARGAEGVDELNARAVEEARALSLAEVEDRAAEIHMRVLTAIEAITDEEWDQKAPYPVERREKLGRLLGAITGGPKRGFGHAFAHIPDLEAYVAGLH